MSTKQDTEIFRHFNVDTTEPHFAKPSCVTLYVVLAAITLSPLFWVRVPPLVDYPNYLARMWILVHSKEVAELAGNYVVHWRILPDLAIDLVVSLLSWILPVEQAGRVFIASAMLLLIGGTLTLHRVLHGRIEIWPIWSVLFVYNAALFWGFLNCLFATGVYLFAFSGWIATRHWRTGPRLGVFSIIASLLLLLHLFAFGLYGLSVATHELARRIEHRRLPFRGLVGWGVVCLQFVPGVVLWYASLAQGGSAVTSYNGLVFKFYAMISPFSFGAQLTAFDLLMGCLTSLFVIFAIKSGSLQLSGQMRLPLAVMLVLVLLMPDRVNGSGFADMRLPVALPFLIIASTRFEVSKKRAVVTVAGAALIVLGLRDWSVSQAWYDYDRWFAEFRAASAVIAPGARLLVVEAPMPEQQQLPGVPASLATVQWRSFSHMAALAVIDRAAFFPYIFTGWTTIDAAPRNRAVAQSEGAPMTPEELLKSVEPKEAKSLYIGPDTVGALPYWRNWWENFDFVLWMDFGGTDAPGLKQLSLVTSGSFFHIYRVVRP
jgi:hypothetical protein